MSASNNLGDFLTSVADAIRSAEGSSSTISAQNFPSRISALGLYNFGTSTYTTTSSSTYRGTFTNVSETPVAFVVVMTSSMGYGSSNNYISSILYDGSTFYRAGLNSSGHLACTTGSISTSYSSSTKKFTVTDNTSDGYYGTGTYLLLYIY